jgi:hypothetical protein
LFHCGQTLTHFAAEFDSINDATKVWDGALVKLPPKWQIRKATK